MVMFIGPYSCLFWRMCVSYADWGFLEVIYLIFSLHFFLDVSLFDLYKRGDWSGIVIGSYFGVICSSFVYIINCIICAECDLDISIL
jgi:hypothetical protein